MSLITNIADRRHGEAWTKERIEKLQKLWGEGLSASQIALRIGGVSRNAVIGKAMRLGLRKRNSDARSFSAPRVRKAVAGVARMKPAASKAPAPSPVAGDRQGWGWRRFSGGSLVSTAPAVAAAANNDNLDDRATPTEPEIPVAERKALVDLEDGDCRWPIGDPLTPGFHFCAQRAAAVGQPYCEHHLHRAYQPPQPRRRLADAVVDDHRPADAPATTIHASEREPV